MSEIIIAGLDLAKNMFQVYRAEGSGRAVLRKKLRRDQVLAFFIALAPCVVAMEARGGVHFATRTFGSGAARSRLGQDLRLIPPSYVRPFGKRQRNDAADAEVICEAARRPSTRSFP